MQVSFYQKSESSPLMVVISVAGRPQETEVREATKHDQKTWDGEYRKFLTRQKAITNAEQSP